MGAVAKSGTTRSVARALHALARAPVEERASLMSRVVPLLADGLDAEVAAYRPELDASGWIIESLDVSDHERMRTLGERSRAFLREAPISFAHFDALRVQPEQQNVLIDQREWARVVATERLEMCTRVHAPLRLDVTPHMRVTLTDGPFLLSWLGLFRAEPFRADEEDLVRQAIPVLRRQLRIERSLFGAVIDSFSALATTLELVALPAFLLRSSGALALANSAGLALIERSRDILADCATAMRRGAAGVPRIRSVATINVSGAGSYAIVTASPDPDRGAARIEAVARERRLTPAEGRVLAQLASGSSNKEIATKLGCSPRTVEVHVTSIILKCGVDSRARLIAWFWSRP